MHWEIQTLANVGQAPHGANVMHAFHIYSYSKHCFARATKEYQHFTDSVGRRLLAEVRAYKGLTRSVGVNDYTTTLQHKCDL